MPDNIEIKVCGMTQIKQVQELAKMGVSYAGFIFYEKSPRYVVGKIKPGELKRLDATIKKVGVFVNEESDKILEIVHNYGLDYVQLHGDESPDFFRKLKGSVKTIKVFRLTGNENLTEILKDFGEVADAYLFDTKADAYGGTGKKFNWDVLLHTPINKLFFLSGGIGPDDVLTVKDFFGKKMEAKIIPDLNSKFEFAPGEKNTDALKKFVDEIRRV